MNIKFFVIFVLVGALCFTTGCKQDNGPTPADLFAGNYYGQLGTGGHTYPDTFKVTAGSSATQINIYDTREAITMAGMVSGDSITSISYTQAGGANRASTSITGNGVLHSKVLTVTLYDVSELSGITSQDTAAFSGTQQ